jgi:hypothetical protein
MRSYNLQPRLACGACATPRPHKKNSGSTANSKSKWAMNATRRPTSRPRRPTAQGGGAARRTSRKIASAPRLRPKVHRAQDAAAAREKKQGQYTQRHARRQGHTEHEKQGQRGEQEQELSTMSSGSTEQTRLPIMIYLKN